MKDSYQFGLGALTEDRDLVKALERIDDLAAFKGFACPEEAMSATREILGIGIVSLGYTARETLLNTLITISQNYDIASADFSVLEDVRGDVEPDLVEYIDDLLDVWSYRRSLT